MTAILSARKYWCEPGEPILWASTESIHDCEYAVEGLERDGDPKRGWGTKALRAAGKGALTVAAVVATATDDGAGSDGGSGNAGPRFADVLVFGPGPDCLAASVIRPWHKKQLPGWSDVEGLWVLTPQRLAWLVAVEMSERLARQDEKGKPGFTGNLVRATASLATGIAVESVKMIGNIGDFPAGKPVELPEVTAGIEISREQFRSVEVVSPATGTGTHSLRLTFADGSGFAFSAGRDPADAERVRSWIAGR
jgi:hypothetical protein